MYEFIYLPLSYKVWSTRHVIITDSHVAAEFTRWATYLSLNPPCDRYSC